LLRSWGDDRTEEELLEMITEAEACNFRTRGSSSTNVAGPSSKRFPDSAPKPVVLEDDFLKIIRRKL